MKNMLKCSYCKKYFDATLDDEWELDNGENEVETQCKHCEENINIIVTILLLLITN